MTHRLETRSGTAHSPPPSPETLAALRELYPEERVRRWSGAAVTAPQRDVLALLDTPRTRHEVAARLGVSPHVITARASRLIASGHVVICDEIHDGRQTYLATALGRAALAHPPRPPRERVGRRPGVRAPVMTANKLALIRLVAEIPGVTVSEMAASRGVTYQAIHATLCKLLGAELVVRTGRGFAATAAGRAELARIGGGR